MQNGGVVLGSFVAFAFMIFYDFSIAPPFFLFAFDFLIFDVEFIFYLVSRALVSFDMGLFGILVCPFALVFVLRVWDLDLGFGIRSVCIFGMEFLAAFYFLD